MVRSHLCSGMRLPSNTEPTVTVNCFPHARHFHRPLRPGLALADLRGEAKGFAFCSAMRAGRHMIGPPSLLKILTSCVRVIHIRRFMIALRAEW